MGEDECTQLLAERGIMLDKVDNCHNFAYTWIQENNTPDKKDAQLHILLSNTTARADSLPTVEPWHEPVLHRFNETHVRWVPIILPPLWEASNENVITTATATVGNKTVRMFLHFGKVCLYYMG